MTKHTAPLTIKEAIEQGLATKKELTEIGTRAKLDKIRTLHQQRIVEEVLEPVDKDAMHEFGYFSCWSTIAFYVRSPDFLHDVRAKLREFYGEWSDKIDSTYVSGEDLHVTYTCTLEDKFPVTFTLEVNYDIHNLPAGLLKPTCKIVSSTSYDIECTVGE